jgi:hypothetical protein
MTIATCAATVLLAAALLVLPAAAAAADGAAAAADHAPAAVGSCESCKNDRKDWFCTTSTKCFKHHFGCALDCHGPCQKTSHCGTCAAGADCSCTQCKDAGYSNYCAAARECYHSPETCDISCHKSGCSSTASCGAPATCNATSCQSGQTCCIDGDGHRFCSPYANATCCRYSNMSCPSAHVCDPPTGRCVAPAPESTKCKECTAVVKGIETDGCTDLCKHFAKSVVCELIVKLKVCAALAELLKKHFSPTQACNSIGMCGAGSCPCGYCTPPLYGNTCLADKKKGRCPTAASASLLGAFAALQQPPRLGARGGEFCLDGHCDEDHAGCCLTCAP